MTIRIVFKKPVKYGSKIFVSPDVTQITLFNNVLSIISSNNLKTFDLNIIKSIALGEDEVGVERCEVPQSD